MSKRTYITSGRLEELRQQLKPTEILILEDVARLSLVSGNQIRRLHYQASDTGRRMARLDLKRLNDERVITRIGRSIGGERAGSEGFVYGLGTAGRRFLGQASSRPRDAWTPSMNHVAHTVAVADLYVRLKEAEEAGRTTLEHFDAEPRCWRNHSGLSGRVILKPDAYAVTGDQDFLDSWFVEVDRSTEPLPRIREKAKAYVRYWQSGREQEREGVFPTVVFVVPDERRRSQLAAALAAQPSKARELFRVVTNDHAVDAITSGELINNQEEEVN